MVTEILVLSLLAFFAGFVDAIAGGGGLIQVPALLAIFPSVPPPVLLGTNKFSSLCGTAIATLRYGWSVPVQWRLVVPAAAVAGVSAVGGAKAAIIIDPAVLRPILLVLLTIMVGYTLAQPRFGEAAVRLSPAGSRTLFVVAAVFGFYDGFFGPAAGSVLMFVLVRFFGLDFLRAAASTKVLNLTTNLCALALFVWTHNVLYAAAVPMAACNIVGGFAGAHFAVRGGNRVVRAVFLGVLSILIVKVFFDLLKGAIA